MPDADLMREYVLLSRRIDRTEDVLKKRKRKKLELEKRLKEQFVDDDVASVKLDLDGANPTLHLHQIYGVTVRAGMQADVVRALRNLDMGHFVNEEPKFNYMSIGAWVREEKRQGRPIPEELERCLNITPVTSVRVRK